MPQSVKLKWNDLTPESESMGDVFAGEAAKFGLKVSSSTRTPQRNRAVGGASRSYHLPTEQGEGRALDVVGDPAKRREFQSHVKTLYGDRVREVLDEGDHTHVAWDDNKPEQRVKLSWDDLSEEEPQAKRITGPRTVLPGVTVGAKKPQRTVALPIGRMAAVTVPERVERSETGQMKRVATPAPRVTFTGKGPDYDKQFAPIDPQPSVNDPEAIAAGLGAVGEVVDVISRPFGYLSTLAAGTQRKIGSGISSALEGKVGSDDYPWLDVLDAAAERLTTGKVRPGYEQPVAEFYKLATEHFGGDPDSAVNQVVRGTLEGTFDPTNFIAPTAVAAKLTGAKPPVAFSAPRRIHHERFGEVVKAENQSGVEAGRIRVTDTAGTEHVIQNPRVAGNREAAYVREQRGNPELEAQRAKEAEVLTGTPNEAAAPDFPRMTDTEFEAFKGERRQVAGVSPTGIERRIDPETAQAWREMNPQVRNVQPQEAALVSQVEAAKVPKGTTGEIGNVEPPASRPEPTGEVGAERVKLRALPRTLEAAQLEKGENLTYLPETIREGVKTGRKNVEEKGVDGAIEHVLRGEAGIDWASTGYATMERMRQLEQAERQAGNITQADVLAAKRADFVGDFAERSTQLGQAISGIRAIEEFAPNRAIYALTKASQRARKRNLSPAETIRAEKIAEDLASANGRIKSLERLLEGRSKAPKVKAKSYQESLDTQAQAALASLRSKAELDFGNLTRPGERGAVRINEPALPGDAELLAQYAASRLTKAKDIAALNKEILDIAPSAEPYLAAIRRRAYSIREDIRQAEIKGQGPERAKTLLQEMQVEISEAARVKRAAEQAKQQAKRVVTKQTSRQERETRQAMSREQRQQADEAARVAQIQEGLRLKDEAETARERLTSARAEYQRAGEVQRKAYRADVRAEREAERHASLWDTPLRNEAAAARERLRESTPESPSLLEDLAGVASEWLLPTQAGGAPRKGSVSPSQFYTEMNREFPGLVTRKNQGEILRRASLRVNDMISASKRVAREVSASKEVRQLWEKEGIDVDTQALLIQRAEATRQQLEARAQMTAEFNRVSRPMWKRVAHEIHSFPRAMQSSIDAPVGRQGIFGLITHPVQAVREVIPATAKGYAALTREEFLKRVTEQQNHPDFDLLRKAGVDFTGLASQGDPRFIAEETFQSTWAEKLPHVRLSEQGFNLGMNDQRLGLGSTWADYGRAQGYTWESNPEFFKQVAKLVNVTTGRGNLSTKAKAIASSGNWLLYSARLQVSRAQLLHEFFNPFSYIKSDPAIRRIKAKEAVKLAVGMGLIYATAKVAGLELSLDADNPDFGKLKAGNAHYDPTGGEAGLVRVAVRLTRSVAAMATGEQKQKDEEANKALRVFLRYGRSKLAPWPGTGINLLTGKNLIGQPANLKFEAPTSLSAAHRMTEQNQAIRMVLPMIMSDMMDAAEMDGWIGVGKATPALGGFGVQTYKSKAPKELKRKTPAELQAERRRAPMR